MLQRLPLPELHDEAALRGRIEYATRAFGFTQELIRFMDQKAFFVISVVGMLTTALGFFTSVIIALAPRPAWHEALGKAAGVAGLVYLVAAFAVIATASSVFMARSHRGGSAGGPGLLFPLAVAGRHGADAGSYLHSLLIAGPDAMLADYAGSITGSALIYELKQRRVNRAVQAMRGLSLVWMALIVLLLLVATVG